MSDILKSFGLAFSILLIIVGFKLLADGWDVHEALLDHTLVLTTQWSPQMYEVFAGVCAGSGCFGLYLIVAISAQDD